MHTIKVNIYADIIIDNSADAALTITADENIIDYVDTEIVDGVINLSQLKWIESNTRMIIKIGAPDLKRLVHDTHDTTKIINLNNESLRVNANIGKVFIDGKTDELRLGAESGKIDALKTKANKVYVNLWDSGIIKINPIEYLWAKVSNDGKLLYQQLPVENDISTKSGGIAININEYKPSNKKLQYITFKIKNNSSNRNNFVVKGPRNDGGKFGYGFPMMPNANRKENWPIGTKIYKENKLGMRKLLVTIKAEDEGTIVNLFD